MNVKMVMKNKSGARALSSRYKNKIANSKRSQVTIFIIIAIVIVAVLLLIFNAKVKTIVKGVFVTPSPVLQLESCMKDKISEGLKIVEKNGGSIAPANSYLYNGEKVEYLCYTNQYYQTCKMQQPLLKEHIERELLEYAKPEIENCLAKTKENLKKNGYSISEGKNEIFLEIIPNKIKIEMRGFTIRKENAERYESFEANYKTKIYDLIMLATSILNFEARFGDSDITIYMFYYPDIKVEKFKQEEGSKIYILTNTKTKEKFVFATRSLSWPAGYGLGLTHKPA